MKSEMYIKEKCCEVLDCKKEKIGSQRQWVLDLTLTNLSQE